MLTNGPTGDSTVVNTRMTRSMAMACTYGLTTDDMKATGVKASSMDLVNILLQVTMGKLLLSMAYGREENVLIGCKMMMSPQLGIMWKTTQSGSKTRSLREWSILMPRLISRPNLIKMLIT